METILYIVLTVAPSLQCNTIEHPNVLQRAPYWAFKLKPQQECISLQDTATPFFQRIEMEEEDPFQFNW